MKSVEELRRELADVERRLAEHYWRFTRSARPPARWPTDLYRRRAKLKEAIEARE